MAQARHQTDSLVNPSQRPPPSTVPFTSAPVKTSTGNIEDPYRSNVLKRPRDEDSAGEEAGTSNDAPAPKRRVKVSQDVLYRIVVPSRQIGKVIGRVGHRIQKIREETKATIKIADAVVVSNLMCFRILRKLGSGNFIFRACSTSTQSTCRNEKFKLANLNYIYRYIYIYE